MSDSNSSSMTFDDMPVFTERSFGRRGGADGQGGRENITCYLKPTPKGEYYSFRLLSFRGKSGFDRKEPYVERYIHTMWVTNSNGKRFPEATVVCPVSRHVSWVPRGTTRYDACPICGHANKAFNQFKQSGYTNREASNINNQFGRKFEGVFPVYVVKDPNNPMNNGKFRALIVGDKKKFDEILETIKVMVRQDVHVFNGGEALDFCLTYGPVEHKSHEGEPNERVWKRNEIVKFKFSKNAYEIPAITKEALLEFPFDEQFYVESSPEELNEFYNRYCVPPAGNTEVDFDDEEDDPVPAPAPKPAPKAVKAAPAPAADDDLDLELDGEPEPAAPKKEEPAPAEKTSAADADMNDIDNLLDEFFDK